MLFDRIYYITLRKFVGGFRQASLHKRPIKLFVAYYVSFFSFFGLLYFETSRVLKKNFKKSIFDCFACVANL